MKTKMLAAVVMAGLGVLAGDLLNLSQVHRGGGATAMPDNSLESYLWCWGNGLVPEADARLTKDGVAIAMHDDNLKRIASGVSGDILTKHINTLTWDEIRDIDIGTKWGKQFSTVRLSTMEAIFAAMKGRPERLLHIDEKGAPPELVAELARKHGVLEQCYYCSWNYARFPVWKKVAPEGKSMIWLGNFPRTSTKADCANTEAFLDKKFAELEANNYEGVTQVQIHTKIDFNAECPVIPSPEYLKKRIAQIHARGMSVQTLVTGPAQRNIKAYKLLLEIGFDHFATDWPFEFVAWMKELRNEGQGTRDKK